MHDESAINRRDAVEVAHHQHHHRLEKNDDDALLPQSTERTRSVDSSWGDSGQSQCLPLRRWCSAESGQEWQ